MHDLSPREGDHFRRMRMSPDLDFKVDRQQKEDELIRLLMAMQEEKNSKMAKKEL